MQSKTCSTNNDGTMMSRMMNNEANYEANY